MTQLDGIGVIRLVSVTLLIVASVTESHVKQIPKRCCSPDQWEADVKNIGTSSRTRDPDGNIVGKVAYDYTNKRWAFEYKDLSDKKSYRRIVFDHQQDSKIMVTPKACYNVSLNMASMDRYCIPANASYHGRYDYGLNRATVSYDIWSYEMLLLPIRVVLRTSADGCLALQDAGLTLTRSQWWWKAGEPSCVPWQFPEQAANGECFRSHVEHRVEQFGTRPSAVLYNMDFRNINLTITDEKMFKIPQTCEVADSWPEGINWINFGNLFLRRMKLN